MADGEQGFIDCSKYCLILLMNRKSKMDDFGKLH